MKVIAFNGSPRRKGNTAQAIEIVFKELQAQGIETEMVQLGGEKLFGCLACYQCMKNKDGQCARKDDKMNEFIEKIKTADGIVIGSPTYFSNVTSEVKAFIDRSGFVNRANGGDFLRGKAGAAVVSVRRAGATFVYSAINFYFGISEMNIPGSVYWNLTTALEPGDIQHDAEGIRTFEVLGKNLAELLKKTRG